MKQPDLLTQTINAITAAITERYRVDAAAPRSVVEELVRKSPDLMRVLTEAETLDAVRRTRPFKNVDKTARRRIYHQLRTYKRNTDALHEAIAALARSPRDATADQRALCDRICALHTSTRERLEDVDSFHAALLPHIRGAHTILDVGCGVHPLLFPFDHADLSSLEKYVAVDSDAVCVDAVRACARARALSLLTAVQWDLDTGWAPLQTAAGIGEFDVAFMFKLVPVIARQQRALLQTLAQTPAERWVVTVSTLSMTRRESIAKRELSVLRRFAALANRRLTAEFSVGEEAGAILEAERNPGV